MSMQQKSRRAADLPAAFREAVLKWNEVGLLLPPVPLELAPRIVALEEMAFGTERRDPADRAGWLEQARDPQAPASVIFGHVGHGINSYQLCYQLIRGPLAVFVRQAFGGVYGDREAEAAQFNDVVERLEELVVHADAARDSARLKPEQRLILAVDDREHSGWEVFPGGAWRDNEDPIDLVMKAVAPK